MARRRASMREGPLAELFRATEAAQRQAEGGEEPVAQEAAPIAPPPAPEPEERTVEHVPSWEEAGVETAEPGPPAPSAEPTPNSMAIAPYPKISGTIFVISHALRF